jgi:heme o synthase
MTHQLAVADASVVLSRPFTGSALASDYWGMTKPDVTFLVAITTAVGFYMGSSSTPSHIPWIPLIRTLVGTVLVASGAATLNQWMEYPFDAQMRRTARRPIASGRIDPLHALLFGAVLALAGLTYLLLAVGALPSFLALATLVGYLCFYTPLKRRSPLATLVGAIPGAVPPLIGWTAARGHFDRQAWILFLIVFLWQFPHFMSIAWMYRDDYARAGYLVLPNGGARDRFVILQTVVPLIGLVPVSVLLVRAGEPSVFYSVAALMLGLGFLRFGAEFAVRRSGRASRRLLVASIIYLPALLAMMMLIP